MGFGISGTVHSEFAATEMQSPKLNEEKDSNGRHFIAFTYCTSVYVKDDREFVQNTNKNGRRSPRYLTHRFTATPSCKVT